jgi:DNA polymerase II large subunit
MGYFETLEEETERAYEVAREARKRGHDIEIEPEVPLAKNLAETCGRAGGPSRY